MSFIPLYSKSGVVETSPFLEIVVNNVALGPVFRDRLDNLEIKLDRRKRPTAELNFCFESFTVEKDGQRFNSPDIVMDNLPLDSKVMFKLGYYNEFKTFGPFEVVEHNITLQEGGINSTVSLEGFGVVRNASDYRVYTTGSVFDIIGEVYKRNGITVKSSKIKEAIKLLEGMIQIPNLPSELKDQIDEILNIDPNDPFVQIGESDEQFLRTICAKFGFSPQMSGKDGVEFATLFFTNKGTKINLRHGVDYPNVKSFSFKSSKTRTSYIRNPPKGSKLTKKVPKRGKKAGKDTGTPAPENQEETTRTEGNEADTKTKQAPKKASPKKPPTNELTADEWENYEEEAPEDPGEPVKQPVVKEKETIKANPTDTKIEQVNQPATKQDNKNRKLGKIIGRKRRAGRVIEIVADLITGSVIPNLGMAIVFDVPSAYHRGDYVIDKIEHSFSTSGFESKLELVRPRPKKKDKKPDKPKSEDRKNSSENNTNTKAPKKPPTPKKELTADDWYNGPSESETDTDGNAVRGQKQ